MQTRLKYFALWCKGWIDPVISEMGEYEQARNCLVLDEYYPSTLGDIICIGITNMEDYLKENDLSFSFLTYTSEIQKNMIDHNTDFMGGIFWTIRDFFRYRVSGVGLDLNSLDKEKLSNLGLKINEYDAMKNLDN